MEQVQQRREAEERWRWEDAELAAELAVSQLVEEEMTWKEERWKLVEVEWRYEKEKKWREAEKAKGKKRKVEEELDLKGYQNRLERKWKNKRWKMYGRCQSIGKQNLKDSEWTRLVGILMVKMIDQLRSITKFGS